MQYVVEHGWGSCSKRALSDHCSQRNWRRGLGRDQERIWMENELAMRKGSWWARGNMAERETGSTGIWLQIGKQGGWWTRSEGLRWAPNDSYVWELSNWAGCDTREQIWGQSLHPGESIIYMKPHQSNYKTIYLCKIVSCICLEICSLQSSLPISSLTLSRTVCGRMGLHFPEENTETQND